MSHINNTKQISIFHNTTNTLNHQDQSFRYLGWIPKSTVNYYKQNSHHF